MKYYDISLVENKWYGFDEVIKPVIIEAKTINELINKTRNTKGLIVLKHPNEDVFRHALDKALVDAILPLRKGSHDYFHHRRTLLDLVTAKIMAKNKISMIFSFKELRDNKEIEQALVWGRLKQDAMICKKKKVPVIVASMAEKEEDLVCVHSLIGFSELLNLGPKALNYVQEKILEREK